MKPLILILSLIKTYKYTEVGKVRDAFLKAVELNPKNYRTRSSLLVFYLNAPGIAGGAKDKALALKNGLDKKLKEDAKMQLRAIKA